MARSGLPVAIPSKTPSCLIKTPFYAYCPDILAACGESLDAASVTFRTLGSVSRIRSTGIDFSLLNRKRFSEDDWEAEE